MIKERKYYAISHHYLLLQFFSCTIEQIGHTPNSLFYLYRTEWIDTKGKPISLDYYTKDSHLELLDIPPGQWFYVSCVFYKERRPFSTCEFLGLPGISHRDIGLLPKNGFFR